MPPEAARSAGLAPLFAENSAADRRAGASALAPAAGGAACGEPSCAALPPRLSASHSAAGRPAPAAPVREPERPRSQIILRRQPRYPGGRARRGRPQPVAGGRRARAPESEKGAKAPALIPASQNGDCGAKNPNSGDRGGLARIRTAGGGRAAAGGGRGGRREGGGGPQLRRESREGGRRAALPLAALRRGRLRPASLGAIRASF